MLEALYQKIKEGKRITAKEGLTLYQKAPWLTLAQLAQERKNQLIGPDIASYTLFRIINYTNVCNINCTFCSFKQDEGASRAYVMDEKEVFTKIDEAISQGADQIFLQGGVHPNLPFEYYTDLLQAIKAKYIIHIRAFSPVEIRHFAETAGLTIAETIRALKEAGLDSVPGAGAEMLIERIRKELSPNKCTTQEWCDILKECHRQGLKGSANIVIGSIESDEEILEHLQVVRDIQDETAGFDSFIPWTFQPQTKDFEVKKIPHHQYLKLVSLARLFLDNIVNIEVSVMVLGPDIGKLALHMGANDISSPVIEENVLRSFGTKSEEEARKLITEAGFNPKRRDFNYDYTPYEKG